MQQLPAHNNGPIEKVPPIRLVMDLGSTAEVVEWSTRRELTGSGLPGSGRGASGFSVASGTVMLAQDGVRRTPWSPAATRVRVDELGWLTAHPTTLASIKLGRFITDHAAGGSMGGIGVDLTEGQRNLDGPFTYPWAYSDVESRIESSAVLAAIAEGAGYTTSWHTSTTGGHGIPQALLMANLNGTTAPRAGTQWTTRTSQLGVTWISRNGQTYLGSGSRVVYDVGDVEVGQWGWLFSSGAANMRFEVAGEGFRYDSKITSGRAAWSLEASTTEVRLTINGAARVITLPPTTNPTRRLLFGATSTALSVLDFDTGVVTNATGGPGATLSYAGATITVKPDGGVRDLSVASPSPTVMPPVRPTAWIEHTGSMISGVFDVAGKKAREVFQDIATKTMGAGWQSETGELVYRNAENLRTGAAVESVIAHDQFESLDWDLDRQNKADRIEVSYTPATTVADKTNSITLWESTDRINIQPGTTIVIPVEITGTTDRLAPFIPIFDTSQAAGRMSRWDASPTAAGTNEDGSASTRPASNALRIETVIKSPSTIEVRVTNMTSKRLFIVDGNGNPCLILRTSLQVQPGEAQTLSWGAEESKATTPFEFECGQWVQEPLVAQQMLSWLVSQMQESLPTLPQVRVVPDLRRQLGDIIRLTEGPVVDPLKTKGIIVGVSMSGTWSGYQQRITVALLSNTYADLKRALIALSIRTYDEFKTYLAVNQLLTYQAFKEHAQRVLVDY